MTEPVWSHVLALSAWTLKKAHIVSCPSPDYKNLMQGKFLTNQAFPPKPYLTV